MLSHMIECWKADLKPSEKLLLVALSEYADQNGFAYASAKSLAMKTGLSKATIKRLTRELEQQGLLEKRETKLKNGGCGTALIRLTIVKMEDNALPDPDQMIREMQEILTDSSTGGGGVTMNPGGGSPRPQGGGHHEPRGGVTMNPPPHNPLYSISNNFKKEKKNSQKEKKEKRSLFDQCFWSIYPRRVAKQQAIQAWMKLEITPDLVECIQRDIRNRLSNDWNTSDKRFVPYPATYLNQQRWTDETDTTQADDMMGGLVL